MDSIISWVKDHMPDLSGLGGLVPQDIGNGQQVWVDPTTGTMIRQYPDGSITSVTPSAVGTQGIATDSSGNTQTGVDQNILNGSATSPNLGSSESSGGGMSAMPLDVLKWLGALALLWIILTALSEYSPNGRTIGMALAGLILFGALYSLGPAAISNIKNVWNATSSNPVQGPSSISGA